jgi:hypothetical protein
MNPQKLIHQNQQRRIALQQELVVLERIDVMARVLATPSPLKNGYRASVAVTRSARRNSIGATPALLSALKATDTHKSAHELMRECGYSNVTPFCAMLYRWHQQKRVTRKRINHAWRYKATATL